MISKALLNKLIAEGRVKGLDEKPHLKTKPKKTDKTKSLMKLHLRSWCGMVGLELFEEYRFDDKRKWRADFAIPALKVLIEYEGLMSEKSRHTTVTGFSKDSEKYNQATLLGWKVLRYTVLNSKDLIRDLERVIS